MTETCIATLRMSDLQRFTMLGGPWAIVLLWGCSHIAPGSIEREVEVCLHAVTVEMAHIS